MRVSLTSFRVSCSALEVSVVAVVTVLFRYVQHQHLEIFISNMYASIYYIIDCVFKLCL